MQVLCEFRSNSTEFQCQMEYPEFIYMNTNVLLEEAHIQGSRKCVSGVPLVSDISSFIGQIEIQGYAKNYIFSSQLDNLTILSYESAILSIVPGSENMLS